ncbi:VOC family protein [Priestia taiwanensis]|uniref:Catechol-2,3-dioxygenase n=1 Tax=Priestia taiwanensis TaxID=1347902 RepID=A0A917AX39_9BACI|nr:VOC family protein [Priestia taiwanensis]MBM7365019.1 catechol 2,3-dioxygenase [Priestia taiwanensis]GGE83407.1 catechol-2,3-dioxygenase [Priestia taiwanensis]
MDFHREPNTFVGNVKLKVANLERSLQFYQQIIGFNVLERTKTTAVLTADGKTDLVTIEQPANVEPKQGRTTGLYHFALLLPQRSDLADIVNHFVQNGIQIGSSDHLVSEALYLSDPDGNGIEIYVDRVPSEWDWNNGEVAMAVDPLDFADLLSTSKEGKGWNGLPVGTVMGHIHLHVSQLKQAEEFYTKGLGFNVVNRFGTQALFISTGNYHHHIGLNTWAGVGAPTPPVTSTGLGSFTLVFPNEESRGRVVANLKAIGSSVMEENDLFVTVDPSGNRINLQV